MADVCAQQVNYGQVYLKHTCACRLGVLEEPVDCKLVQLINVEGDPCSVALVQSPQRYKHLVVNQLHTQLLQGACFESAHKCIHIYIYSR